MAVTGLLMVLFVIGHLLGNLNIFRGADGINSYAFKLHELAPVVWGTRIVMGVAVLVHIYLAVVITLENQEAKPTKYAVTRRLKATFAGRTMIWTGIIIALFVLYHLAQFTLRWSSSFTTNLVLANDALNRFDVFGMVVNAFAVAFVVAIYVVAMIAVFLHISHGFQSSWQTMGLATTKTLPELSTVGTWLSTIFLIGLGSIPVVVFFGILR